MNKRSTRSFNTSFHSLNFQESRNILFRGVVYCCLYSQNVDLTRYHPGQWALFLSHQHWPMWRGGGVASGLLKWQFVGPPQWSGEFAPWFGEVFPNTAMNHETNESLQLSLQKIKPISLLLHIWTSSHRYLWINSLYLISNIYFNSYKQYYKRNT